MTQGRHKCRPGIQVIPGFSCFQSSSSRCGTASCPAPERPPSAPPVDTSVWESCYNMRPTELGIGIPSTKTPGPYYRVRSTNQGDLLGPWKRSFLRTSSFSRSQRFGQYEEMARRTGAVGPGAYSLSLGYSGGKVRISPPHPRRPGLYISGNLLVCDPALGPSPVKKRSFSKSCRDRNSTKVEGRRRHISSAGKVWKSFTKL